MCTALRLGSYLTIYFQGRDSCLHKGSLHVQFKSLNLPPFDWMVRIFLKRLLWGGKPGEIRSSLWVFFLLMALIVSCGIHSNNSSLCIFFLSSQCLIVYWIYSCKTQNGSVERTSLLEIFLKLRSSIQHFKIETIKDERNACIFASATYLRCFIEWLPCCFLIFLCWIFDECCSA